MAMSFSSSRGWSGSDRGTFAENRVAQARRTVKATRNLDDLKSALAVLLPAKAGLTLEGNRSPPGGGAEPRRLIASKIFERNQQVASCRPLCGKGHFEHAVLSRIGVVTGVVTRFSEFPICLAAVLHVPFFAHCVGDELVTRPN